MSALAAALLTLAPALPGGGVQQDIVYKTVNQVPLHLDLYPASGAGPHPLVLWIHGGAWTAGNKSLPASQISGLLAGGVSVASLQYRLTSQGALFGASEVLFPAQLEDVQDALRFLRQNAANYDLDPARFGVWGASAGGHLAALAGLRGDAADPAGDTSVQAIGDAYGPTELFTLDADAVAAGCTSYLVHDAPGSPESRLVGFDGPGEGLGVLRSLPGLPEHQLVLDASPLLFVGPDAPPLLALHGQVDCTISWLQSQRLVDALQALGRDANLLTHAGGHVLPADYLDDFWAFFIDELGAVPAGPERLVVAAEDFTSAAIQFLDPQAVPADFDSETVVEADQRWGGCNLSTTLGGLPHAVGLDPAPQVSTDGGALLVVGGALAEGSRAYTRFSTTLDLEEGPELRLRVSKASAQGGVRLRLLLRAGGAWWRSEDLATPQLAGPAESTDLDLDLDGLTWRRLSPTNAIARDMDELDDGGELGALPVGVPGQPPLDLIDGAGLELAGGNVLQGMLAIERLELATRAPGTGYCDGGSQQTSACPCGNEGAAGRGCANSTGFGGSLRGSGSSSVARADLVLRSEGLPPSRPALFFQGTQRVAAGAGQPFGDGLRCAGGAVVRLGLGFISPTGVLASDGSAGQLPAGPIDLAASGGAVPGEVWRYQLWYRDSPAAVCGAGFNLTSAYEVDWRP